MHISNKLRSLPALVIASAALFVALSGGAYAAYAGVTSGSSLMNHSIPLYKLTHRAITRLHGANGVHGINGVNGEQGARGATGAKGDTGARGPQGDTGAKGDKGDRGPAGPAQLEGWSSCTPTLCIDASPQGPNGLDGSGGWGWNDATNAPVSTLKVGQPANFTVTVMEPNPDSSPASITLTYSSQDLALDPNATDETVGTTPFDRGGVMTFDYAGGFHNTDKSVGFTFTPQNATAQALVTATVQVDGQTASATYPVAISG